MAYSRQLKALNTREVFVALHQLLNQINLVQDETERQIERINRNLAELRAGLQVRGSEK